MFNRTLAGTYEILEELGSGGGGVVYKAWHNRLKKEVVLKELRMGTSASLDIQRGEVDILKTLKHSYLPQLYDFVVDGARVYTVIDYIPGQSVDKLLSGGKRFSQQQVLLWARQLLEALVYLHRQTPPILHSDIKPANVMLTPQGDICLIDFNISLLLGEQGAVAMGRSRGYAPPEQYGAKGQPAPPAGSTDATEWMDESQATEWMAEGTEWVPGEDATELFASSQEDGPENATAFLIEGQAAPHFSAGKPANRGQQPVRPLLDVRSDIYSLGATLYHMLTGECPDADARRVKPLSEFGLPLSQSVVFIVEKAMQPDPELRFHTAEQMLRAVVDIKRMDRRWKMQLYRRNVAVVLFLALFAAGGVCAYWGTQVMAWEKEDAYNELVYQISQAGDPQLDGLLEQAVELFPNRVDAYHAKAVNLAEQRRLEESRAYIAQILPTLHLYQGDASGAKKLGDLYFLVANSYFEEDDYHNAVSYYQSAVEWNQDNPQYYRDYAISLARTGEVEAAQRLLSQAEQSLGSDSVELLKGEIAFAQGDENTAVEHFQSALRLTADDYIRYRAYRISSDVYKGSGACDSEIALLEEARQVLPSPYFNEITERLADACVRAAQTNPENAAEYYESAAQSFQELLSRGYSTFHTRQNLGILYHQLGQWGKAEELFGELAADFPEDYRIPMRLAYLYADMQTSLPNQERDYTEAYRQFGQAAALYQAGLKSGAADPEMQMLEELMDQLAQGGWI